MRGHLDTPPGPGKEAQRGRKTQRAASGGAEESSGLDRRFQPRARTGHLRLGISEAKYARARRQVMARRSAQGLLLPDPSAARGRDRAQCGEGTRPPASLGQPGRSGASRAAPAGPQPATSFWEEKGALWGGTWSVPTYTCGLKNHSGEFWGLFVFLMLHLDFFKGPNGDCEEVGTAVGNVN